ncbi:uncharacterized protein N0V89_002865 [Didymosphaeria variabile]|uniref:Uncharacterized protein n=1 Tax=Didymosphaeria variabile TaxID=1932322 RepID=A0A9W8XSH0_9PLEO|nr:uncharacterized protein N0V89_002865 [Didymosphaeria variabile]KAJ4358285.1 hypothetical protein N0V89_002865 [Didymosphaeria variabile]
MRGNEPSTAHREVDTEKRASKRSQACNSRNNYSKEDIELLVRKTIDGTDTSRISNEKVRKLVEDIYELRPKYEPPGLKEREGTVSLLEFLQESAIEPSKQLRSVPSSRVSLHAPALFASLKKTFGFLRIRSAGFKSESSPKPSRVEPLVFEDHVTSPIASTLIPREAVQSLDPVPPKKKATPATPGGHSRAQEYPPDTPDRPAPLRIRPRPARSQPLSDSSSSRHMLSPKNSVSPSQYTRQPRSSVYDDPFVSKVDGNATRCGTISTTTSKITDGATADLEDLFEYLQAALKHVQLPNSESSSVYSDTHEPKRYSAIVNSIAESCHDTIVKKEEHAYASLCTSNTADNEVDWETVQESESELEVRSRHHSYYDSDGFLIQDSDLQKEDVGQETLGVVIALLTLE